MDVYTRVLPMVFPYVTSAKVEHVKAMVEALMQDDRADVSTGSSFCVSVDVNSNDNLNLWLSQASFDFIYDCLLDGLIKDEACWMDSSKMKKW